MVVVTTGTDQKTIKIIPRFEGGRSLRLDLFNKTKGEEITVEALGISFIDGILLLSFSHDFKEGETYSYKLLDPAGTFSDGTVIARGIIFVTDQVPQEYNIEENLYTYSTI